MQDISFAIKKSFVHKSFVKESFRLTSEDIRGRYHESPAKFRGMAQKYKEYVDFYQDELEQANLSTNSELNEILNSEQQLRAPKLKKIIRNDDIEVYSTSKFRFFKKLIYYKRRISFFSYV